MQFYRERIPAGVERSWRYCYYLVAGRGSLALRPPQCCRHSPDGRSGFTPAGSIIFPHYAPVPCLLNRHHLRTYGRPDHWRGSILIFSFRSRGSCVIRTGSSDPFPMDSRRCISHGGTGLAQDDSCHMGKALPTPSGRNRDGLRCGISGDTFSRLGFAIGNRPSLFSCARTRS